jgi:cold shock CspA family protein
MLAYDRAAGSGTCVLDDGVQLDVLPGALEGSGLRFLRPGQRVTVTTVTDDEGRTSVDTVRILGVQP